MMETYEDIQAMLALGDLLTFPTFTIYGISEIDRGEYQMEQSFSTIEHLDWGFLVSTKDYNTHSIIVGNVFTSSDDTFTYTYTVSRPHQPYGDGWSRLPVNLTARANV